jgi:hypothetical protein
LAVLFTFAACFYVGSHYGVLAGIGVAFLLHYLFKD